MSERTYTQAELDAAVALALEEAANIAAKKCAGFVKADSIRNLTPDPTAVDRLKAEAEQRGMERAEGIAATYFIFAGATAKRELSACREVAAAIRAEAEAMASEAMTNVSGVKIC